MLLNMLGITWNPRADGWDNMYNELTRFKKEFGHLKIPSLKKEYTKLLVWCYAQRKSFAKQKLSTEQIKKLNEIGFTW